MSTTPLLDRSRIIVVEGQWFTWSIRNGRWEFLFLSLPEYALHEMVKREDAEYLEHKDPHEGLPSEKWECHHERTPKPDEALYESFVPARFTRDNWTIYVNGEVTCLWEDEDGYSHGITKRFDVLREAFEDVNARIEGEN